MPGVFTVPATLSRWLSTVKVGLTRASSGVCTLPRNTNQALGIGEYAIKFIREENDRIAPSVYHRVALFHLDSVLCGLSALALRANAPSLLRAEALRYPGEFHDKSLQRLSLLGTHANMRAMFLYDADPCGACVFGNPQRCAPEKAVAANCAAVREWDSNGTVFGFNKKLSNHQAGEFGHNDFYPVCVAGVEAAREPVDGRTLLRAMICLDEIRGRLAEVFSLRTFKIDHVLHGAIGSAAVYGALVGATAEQVESAIGMLVAHYVPFRAIRSGDQLSDSKGASAALSAEMAVLCMRRAMKGFVGPKDIFRNPESVFRWNVKTPEKESPFDLMLCTEGEDFAVMGMHFKLGLYEHQSAGALEGLVQLLSRHPEICNSSDAIASVKIVAYEPAFSIIGDKAKRDPQTRQSADHSMVYIVSTLLRKATELEELPHSTAGLWSALILGPHDYSQEAIHHPHTRALMEKVTFVHGGKDYDDLYPEGIPTSVEIVLQDGSHFDSGMVLFPAGHSRNEEVDLEDLLHHKFRALGALALPKEKVVSTIEKLLSLHRATPQQVQELYAVEGLSPREPIY